MTTPGIPGGDNLTRGTLAGLKWTYGASAGGALLQIGYTAAMSRLLEPGDFGLLAMAAVFLRFGTYFARMGISSAIIQKPELTERDVRVAFTTSTLLGLLFAGLLAVAAPLASGLFDNPDVIGIVRVLSLTFLIEGMGRTATSLLRREMRFSALAFVEITTYTLSYLVVGLSLAFAGAGVWSLVAAALCQSATSSVLAYRLARHPVAPLLAGREARVLYGFGSRVSIISFLEYIGSSLDVVAIGRFAGHGPLGQYNRAHLLVNLPLEQITSGLSRVLFPTFSRIQGDLARVRRGYLGGLRIFAGALVPTAAGIAVAASEITRVVLGPQWDTAASVLPLLAMASALRFLTHLAGVVCEATGTLNRKLALQTFSVVLLAGLLLAANEVGGLHAFALAVVLAEFVRHLLYVRLMRRLLTISGVQLWHVYGPSVLAAGVVGGAIAAVSAALRSVGVPVAAVFVSQVATGAVTLVLLLWWGPLAGLRHEVHERLEAAGVLTNPSFRIVDRLLRVGR